MPERYSKEEKDFAQSELNKIADKINSAKVNGQSLSPLEKFLMAYNYVTNFEYNIEDYSKGEDALDSRTIEGIFNKGKIVCAGYSKLLRAICDGIGIPCMEHGENHFIEDISDDSLMFDESHSTSIAVIKDDKYGIDGAYYADSCFDSRFGSDNYKGYIYCLLKYGDARKSDKHKEFVLFPKYQTDLTGGTGVDINECVLKLNKELGLTSIEFLAMQNGGFIGNKLLPNLYELQDKAEHYIEDKIDNATTITPQQFSDALTVVKQAEGMKEQDAEDTVRQTMRYNAYKAGLFFKTDECESCFCVLHEKNPNLPLFETLEDKEITLN